MTHMEENLPTMQDPWVGSLGWEDPLEKGMATNSSILAKNSMNRAAWRATVYGVAESDSTEQITHIHTHIICESFKSIFPFTLCHPL